MSIFPKREGNMPISLKPSWIYIFSNIMRNLPWNPTNVNSLCKKVRHLQTTVKKKHSSLLALEFLVFRTLLFCQKKTGPGSVSIPFLGKVNTSADSTGFRNWPHAPVTVPHPIDVWWRQRILEDGDVKVQGFIYLRWCRISSINSIVIPFKPKYVHEPKTSNVATPSPQFVFVGIVWVIVWGIFLYMHLYNLYVHW